MSQEDIPADIPGEFPAPHRRHRLVLKLEADDMDELAGALRQIGFYLQYRTLDGETPYELTSDGWATGYDLTLTTDESMNGEQYRERLQAWAARRRRTAD